MWQARGLGRDRKEEWLRSEPVQVRWCPFPLYICSDVSGISNSLVIKFLVFSPVPSLWTVKGKASRPWFSGDLAGGFLTCPSFLDLNVACWCGPALGEGYRCQCPLPCLPYLPPSLYYIREVEKRSRKDCCYT